MNPEYDVIIIVAGILVVFRESLVRDERCHLFPGHGQVRHCAVTYRAGECGAKSGRHRVGPMTSYRKPGNNTGLR